MQNNNVFKPINPMNSGEGTLNKLFVRRKPPANYKLRIYLDEEIPEGMFKIEIGSSNFDCLFKKADSDYLYSFFEPYRENRDCVSGFVICSWYYFVQGNVLSVNDPIFHHYDKLTTGRFLGNEKEDYIEYLTRTVTKVVKYCEVLDKDIIFYESSETSDANIHASLHIMYSFVAIDFQILPFPGFKEDFEKNTSINVNELSDRADTTQIIQKQKNKLTLISDIGSKRDMISLYEFCNKLGIPPKYDVEMKNNIIVWLCDAFWPYGDGHSALEDRPMPMSIDMLIRSLILNKDIYLDFVQLLVNFDLKDGVRI